MSANTPLFRFMRKLDARGQLGAGERQAILTLPGHPVQVPTNQDFVRLGEVVSHACLIVDGLAGRFGRNRDGARQITALHIAGDMADIHSVVIPKAKTALQALSVTTILKVPNEALRDAARRFPRLADAFWRESVIDGSVLSEWVVNVGRRSAMAAMSHLICEMACRYNGAEPAGDMDYDFVATQNQLADMLGLTPVHVNRTLMELKRMGVVTFARKRVTIHDWQQLARIGEFDAEYLHLDAAAKACPAEQLA